MIRLTACQLLEGQIHVVLKGLIVLAHLHGVDELDERGEVLFLLGGFVVDIADKRRVEQRLEVMMEQIVHEWGIKEEMKSTDSLGWASLMNQARHCADEVILDELIYD